MSPSFLSFVRADLNCAGVYFLFASGFPPENRSEHFQMFVFETYDIISAMSVNQTQLGIQGTVLSPLGQRAAGPITFNFATLGAGPLGTNLSAQMQQGLIDFAKSLYIDNSLNANTVTITFSGGFQVQVKPFTQGWYSIVCGRPIQFSITSGANTGSTTLWLANYEVSPFQWATQ